ncbi:hypothetical protein COM24_06990 [Bacillus toyonensis]|uniref:hypothetical protein n=1 Tax=Bacillus TaxID=1386 RepID=UPI0006A8C735|nr:MULTISPECIES: hypothetical protein [Bacillus cereus group]CUB50625.1 hypothetical protein BN2127_JRS10_00142 [Bacillus subtilis]MBJ7935465.1 hypothetical protein [Bacillus cereus]MCU5223971.1 hypothetical protein [Bacillus tropicus]MCU5501769.1 hypothetical protein [Bacillus cereus]PES55882.1 hypothetical protein CN499_05495 [Bacillus thuringiensis]
MKHSLETIKTQGKYLGSYPGKGYVYAVIDNKGTDKQEVTIYLIGGPEGFTVLDGDEHKDLV